ncbi:MAG: MFS transporter [Anaerolineae bacterium]
MQTESATSTVTASNKWLALIGIGLGVLMATLDSSIVNISLPTLVEELNTTLATIQWVVLSYLLVVTSLMLGVARLGDMFGKKKLYNAGLVLFTLGSLLCGTSPDVRWLIGFRAVQGIGAVMMQALGMAIVTEIFPSSERGRALGILGGVVSFGIAAGPVIGGLLIGLVGWRSIFLVNVPLGLLTAFIVWRVVPPSAQTQAGQRFDVPGAVILLVTLACYSLGLTMGQARGFADTTVLALLSTALVGLVAFLVVETRVHQPMVDLSLFRNRLFSINLVMGMLVFIVLASLFIMPFFLELVKRLPTQQVGLLIGAVPISMALVAPVSGSLSDRFGSRGISLIGLVILLAACVGLGTITAEVSVFGYLLRVMPIGIGMGMFQSPNNSAIMGAAPRERLGVASGLLNLSRTLGQTTGLPLMGAIFTGLIAARTGQPAGGDLSTVPAADLVAGVAGTFRYAAGFVLVAAVLAVVALLTDRRQRRLQALSSR